MQAIVASFLNPILPVFVIMLVGMLFGRCGFFDSAAARSINRFVFYVAVPALIFSLISGAAFDTVEPRLLIVYFLSEMAMLAVGASIARLIFRRGAGESLLIGMAACFVNHVFFVLPIARFLYGEPAVIPITAVIVVDTTVIFAGAIVALEIATHRDEQIWRLWRFFIRNPVLVSVALGVTVNLFGIPVHDGIVTYCSFTGAAAAPAALFALGVTLSRSGGGCRGGDRLVLVTTGLKILVHPLIAWLLLGVFRAGTGTGPDAILLLGAGPCGAMPFVLALQYGIASERIGLAIVYSTIASLFSLAIIA